MEPSPEFFLARNLPLHISLDYVIRISILRWTLLEYTFFQPTDSIPAKTTCIKNVPCIQASPPISPSQQSSRRRSTQNGRNHREILPSIGNLDTHQFTQDLRCSKVLKTPNIVTSLLGVESKCAPSISSQMSQRDRNELIQPEFIRKTFVALWL